MAENKQTGVDATVEEILRSLDAMTKADPSTPDERSMGSGEPSAPMDAPPPGGEPPHDEGQEQESLEDIYGQMAPEELEEHMAAIQKVMAMKAGAGPEGSPAPSPPAPSGPAPGGSPPAPMMRSETMAKNESEQPQAKGHFHPEQGCEVCAARDLKKAERDQVVQLQKSQQETDAKIAGLANAMLPLARMLATGQAPKPLRKSIENISDLGFVPRGGGDSPASPSASEAAKKVAGMKPAQIAAALNEKIPTLAKAERDKVSAYYEGRAHLSEIAHLLVA